LRQPRDRSDVNYSTVIHEVPQRARWRASRA
jgi:hypothetical protein